MQATNGQLIRACADACNSRTYIRGQSYHRNGKVIDFTWYEEDGLLVGEVEGSYQSSYTVEVEISQGLNGVEVSSDCSCPVYDTCKHFLVPTLSVGIHTFATNLPIYASPCRRVGTRF